MLIQWNRNGDIRMVWASTAVTGFGLAWHPSMLYFLPVLLAGFFIMGPWRKLFKPRALLIAVLSGMAGLSFYAYLPIHGAAHPPVQFQEIDSLKSFYRFTTAADIRDENKTVGVLRMPSLGQLGGRLSEVVRQS